MSQIKQLCKKITDAKWFEFLITIVILVNSILIGVETYTSNETIKIIQLVNLGISLR